MSVDFIMHPFFPGYCNYPKVFVLKNHLINVRVSLICRRRICGHCRHGDRRRQCHRAQSDCDMTIHCVFLLVVRTIGNSIQPLFARPADGGGFASVQRCQALRPQVGCAFARPIARPKLRARDGDPQMNLSKRRVGAFFVPTRTTGGNCVAGCSGIYSSMTFAACCVRLVDTLRFAHPGCCATVCARYSTFSKSMRSLTGSPCK